MKIYLKDSSLHMYLEPLFVVVLAHSLKSQYEDYAGVDSGVKNRLSYLLPEKNPTLPTEEKDEYAKLLCGERAIFSKKLLEQLKFKMQGEIHVVLPPPDRELFLQVLADRRIKLAQEYNITASDIELEPEHIEDKKLRNVVVEMHIIGMIQGICCELLLKD